MTRQDRAAQDETKRDTTREDRTRQDQTRPARTRPDQTRQDKERQDKARQDKTRQDKLRQAKTRKDIEKQAERRQGKANQVLLPCPLCSFCLLDFIISYIACSHLFLESLYGDLRHFPVSSATTGSGKCLSTWEVHVTGFPSGKVPESPPRDFQVHLNAPKGIEEGCGEERVVKRRRHYF